MKPRTSAPKRRAASTPRLEEAVPDELARAVKERHAILFAGAGLSMNVGLPSWQKFIDRMGEELGLDAKNLLGPAVSYHTLASADSVSTVDPR